MPPVVGSSLGLVPAVRGWHAGQVYAVAAISEQPGPPDVPSTSRRDWNSSATSQPVGTQHAVPRTRGTAAMRFALCGADLEGWLQFNDLGFDPRGSATCQRCAQLVTAAVERGKST
jgi:hypothetical protein